MVGVGTLALCTSNGQIPREAMALRLEIEPLLAYDSSGGKANGVIVCIFCTD